MLERIDAHSHFGKTLKGPDSSLSDYIPEAEKLHISACIASHGPTPVYSIGSSLFVPCRWVRKESNEFEYVEQIYDQETGELLSQKKARINPYHEANMWLLQKAESYNRKNMVKIYVMVLHHPKLDTTSELIDMISDPNVIAVKLHGVATATGPEDVTPERSRLLLEFGKPVIVHTDTFFGQPINAIRSVQRLNDPRKWVLWARDTGVRTLITHGARLSEEAIRLARDYDNIKIGIGPDLLLESSPDRLFRKTDSVIEDLLKLVQPNQLLADIDYGWNVLRTGEWQIRDWNMYDRIEEIGTKVGLTQTEIQMIEYDNAENFYRINKKSGLSRI